MDCAGRAATQPVAAEANSFEQLIMLPHLRLQVPNSNENGCESISDAHELWLSDVDGQPASPAEGNMMVDAPIEPGSSMSVTANPLAGWRNDDIMLSTETRDYVQAHDPVMFAVLDWPEMRQLFMAHEQLANQARKRTRRNGTLTLAVAAVGLIFYQIFEKVDAAPHWIANVAGLVTVASAVAGLVILLRAKGRSRWLANRLWTERLRQLHFQILVNHAPLVAGALREWESAGQGGPDFAELQAIRARLLAEMAFKIEGNEADCIARIIDDEAEVKPWIDPAWPIEPTALADDGSVNRLLDMLAQHRIDIQIEYVRKSIRPGFHSPITRGAWIKAGADMLTIIAIAAGFVAYLVGVFNPAPVAATKWVLIFQSLCSAIIVYLAAMDGGLRIHADADRYRWYLASVEDISRRFAHSPSPATRLSLLRELECRSYQEMRRFFLAHRGGRFLF